MEITKLGHCCLVIEIDGVKILTDPGAWTSEQNQVKDIDIILITHEHLDHLHVESVKAILANNPPVVIYTNSGVGKILGEAGIGYKLLEKGAAETIKNILFESFECPHGEIYSGIPLPQNTGYRIGNKLFYPGDSFTNPQVPVEILALPVAGPWMKISEAIDYAKAVKPQVCFPVHDGMIRHDIAGAFHAIAQRVIEQSGIKVVPLLAGESHEF